MKDLISNLSQKNKNSEMHLCKNPINILFVYAFVIYKSLHAIHVCVCP